MGTTTTLGGDDDDEFFDDEPAVSDDVDDIDEDSRDGGRINASNGDGRVEDSDDASSRNARGFAFKKSRDSFNRRRP